MSCAIPASFTPWFASTCSSYFEFCPSFFFAASSSQGLRRASARSTPSWSGAPGYACAMATYAASPGSIENETPTSRAANGSSEVVSVSNDTISAALEPRDPAREIRFRQQRLVPARHVRGRDRRCGRRQRRRRSCRRIAVPLHVPQPALEAEALEQRGEPLAVALARREIGDLERQRHVVLHRDELARLAQPVARLPQVVADDAGDLVGVREHALERAVLRDPLRRGLGADLLDARNVVDRVADEREVVDDLLRRDAELRLHRRLVERLVRHRVDQRDVRIDELREVLVAGRHDGADAGARRLLRERGDDVVRFDALDHEQRPAHRADRFHERLDLRGEIVGHRRAVRLVLRIHFVAERLALGVEDAAEEICLVVVHQAP